MLLALEVWGHFNRIFISLIRNQSDMLHFIYLHTKSTTVLMVFKSIIKKYISAVFFRNRYVVKEAHNRLYGILQEDGSFSGMMGELFNKVLQMRDCISK